MQNEEKLSAIQKNIAEIRTILNVLIKTSRNDDKIPVCLDETYLLLDRKLTDLDKLF